jgi:hypothetical protein
MRSVFPRAVQNVRLSSTRWKFARPTNSVVLLATVTFVTL